MTNKCCICKNIYEGYGHNPYPYKDNGRCCDECNFRYVIRERLKRLTNNLKEMKGGEI